MSDGFRSAEASSSERRAVAAVAACKGGTPGEPEGAETSEVTPVVVHPPANPKLIRVTSVPTAVEGNLLPALIAEFQAANGYEVQLTTNVQLYDDARAGKVDLAISHYGHKHAEDFVVDGLGEWPRTIFSNQLALAGPKSDPAGLRGVDDAGEAFRRIAAGGHPYLMNELEGLRYVTEILWHLAGKPDKSRWLRAHERDDALVEAAKAGAYMLWGLTPFLRVKKRERLAMAPHVLNDAIFQRLMVSIVVQPKIAGVNVEGARAFQRFLLEPETQAKMRSIDYSAEEKIVVWVPAGRHNRFAVLPGTKG